MTVDVAPTKFRQTAGRLIGRDDDLGYRARLFFCESAYPWQSAQHDLAEARRFIEKHGYWRRKEELEDAESAILGKPTPTQR